MTPVFRLGDTCGFFGQLAVYRNQAGRLTYIWFRTRKQSGAEVPGSAIG